MTSGKKNVWGSAPYELEKHVLLTRCNKTEKREGVRVHAVGGTRLRGGTGSRRNTAPAFSPYREEDGGLDVSGVLKPPSKTARKKLEISNQCQK